MALGGRLVGLFVGGFLWGAWWVGERGKSAEVRMAMRGDLRVWLLAEDLCRGGIASCAGRDWMPHAFMIQVSREGDFIRHARWRLAAPADVASFRTLSPKVWT